MTSDEIQATVLPPSNNVEFIHVNQWLKEIAYQLAVMNERQVERDNKGIGRILENAQRTAEQLLNQGLGSPVRDPSGSEVRGRRHFWQSGRCVNCGMIWQNTGDHLTPCAADKRTTPPNSETRSIQS